MNAPVPIISPNEKDDVRNLLEIPLLDGVFDADDSHEPILQLLHDLQRYHQKRNFSHKERFGKPDPWSVTMLDRLSQAISESKQMIEDARHSNIPLVVDSSIRIEIPQ